MSSAIHRCLWTIGCVLVATRCASAWGVDGHAIVAELAARQLSAAAREQVKRLLPDQTLASIASWADDVRDTRPETARWHYVRMPREAEQYSTARDCAVLPEGDCVIAALRRFTATLADGRRPAAERADALKFIVHLIGDLHQPLHVGGTPDRGGNGIQVLLFGETTNLHDVWDTGLIAHSGVSASDYVARLAPMTVNAGGTPVSWAEEAHRLAVRHAYVFPADRRLDRLYDEANRPIIDLQLARAGARLARVLNESLIR